MAKALQTQQDLPLQDYANQTTVAANAIDVLDAAFCTFSVISITTTAAPAVTNGARYLVPASGTGAWAGWDDSLAFGQSSTWVRIQPVEGWEIRLDSSPEKYRFDGTNWIESSTEIGTITNTITANVTQTQGQSPLTSSLNRITVCANVNDTVTLPTAVVGRKVIVVNDGAQTCQVFPASGDAINLGAVDASITIATIERKTLAAITTALWVTV